MNFIDQIPREILFPVTFFPILLAHESGFRLGNTHTAESKKSKEKITSENASSIIAFLGFIFVFTFNEYRCNSGNQK